MKKEILLNLLLVFLLLLITNCDKKDNEIINSHLCNKTPTTNILLIGNSLFGHNNVAVILKNIIEKTDKDVYVGSRIVGGSSLEFHSTDEVTDAEIFNTNWDYVILQGTGRLTCYQGNKDKIPDCEDIPAFSGLKALQKKITDKCSLTKVVFVMPWAYEDGMTWSDDNVDSYEIMQEKIYNCTMNFADELDIIIAPVGYAWQEVISEQNTPHYLHSIDLSHPAIRGTILMAYVLYSTIFKESSEGNLYKNYISQEEINYFQKIASDIVLENLDLWQITE